ncbi:microsomal signal peptidase subunit (gp23), putative [Talaromyces stipitatus ATCC 10500]|uniref:Signal peptidase subunit 3 n=1 Tax=Talaromyces stipitatus (strain ATCC 10500 / CBS 375.48 / QM 6759 / NRRL 1006) TaxID=441959 RepID=B8MDG2_TALSN|nr:microsomal signal peptidase subunit (gp23), putative [Talaromyces stipitatus ATCC 10500]EED17925.1 microsomal signal peptidase subunit (gp23), putative [Talaromyces stipitatus ATCC 10500]
MHSASNRVQGVFGFFTTVAAFVAGFAALSVLLHPATDVSSSIGLTNVQVVRGRPHYYSSKREEYARIEFDLDADLSPLFNWNTKQLFVYVLASYPASSAASENPHNSEAIIWDMIIPAPESPYSFSNLKERFFPSTTKSVGKNSKKTNNKKTQPKKTEQQQSGILHLRNQKSKYQITDISGKIAERENVTLTVGWNVQPWVGALLWSEGTGAWPRTEGQVGRSKSFKFPAIKTKSSTGTTSQATYV